MKPGKAVCALLAAGMFLLPALTVPGRAAAAQAVSQQEAKLSPRLRKIAGIIKNAAPCHVYFSDLTQKGGLYRGNETMPSASMIKVFILALAYQDIADGTLSRNETFTLTRDNVVGGSGTLQNRAYGTRVPLKELLEKMIIDSDNTATNILIDRLGMDAVNALDRQLGLAATRLERKMMDRKALEEGRDNTTCAADMAFLLESIYKGTLISPAASGWMLQVLRRQQQGGRLQRFLPEDVPLAHKCGDLDGIENDAGLFLFSGRPYLLVVLTSHQPDARTGQETIGLISSQVYHSFIGKEPRHG